VPLAKPQPRRQRRMARPCVRAFAHLCFCASAHLCFCASAHLCFCAFAHLCFCTFVLLCSCARACGCARAVGWVGGRVGDRSVSKLGWLAYAAPARRRAFCSQAHTHKCVALRALLRLGRADALSPLWPPSPRPMPTLSRARVCLFVGPYAARWFRGRSPAEVWLHENGITDEGTPREPHLR
jgi:hypothetical protein